MLIKIFHSRRQNILFKKRYNRIAFSVLLMLVLWCIAVQNLTVLGTTAPV